MRTYYLLFVLFLWATPLAYSEVMLNGYLEPQYSVAYHDDTFLQLNTNKLRIDLGSDLSDKIAFTGNINYINYNGQRNWNMLDFLPRKLKEQIPKKFTSYCSYEYKDDCKLDNAYLRLYYGILTATIGKQQMSVGSGYAWNPTDLFNTKSILDPTYEQPGVNGFRLDIGISADYTFTLFYSPENTWSESGKLMRFLGRISHFDYSLSVGQNQTQHTDYFTFKQGEERRILLGIDMTGELFGIGCWTENAFNSMEDSIDYWENIIGVDYTFSSGWYVMSEYYHNDQGNDDCNEYSLNDWMRYFTDEAKTLARDQVYFYSFYPITDLTNVGGSVVYAVSDNSTLLIPTLEYSISDDVVLTLFGSVYTGKEGAMYSNDMGNGAIIRLRAYF